MATRIISGPRTWEGDRDSEGHRTFKVQWLVESLSADGPATVMATPGLFVPGAIWAIDNDADIWAYCLPTMTVRPDPGYRPGEPVEQWVVEQNFSTKPPDRQRCQDLPIEDPLLEPPKVSGGFTKYSEEATQDRFGVPLLTSSMEQIRGPQVEFDKIRGTVRIEQNVINLQLPLLAALTNTVNAFPLWGMPRRTIKMHVPSWEQKWFGQCHLYYTRVLEFEIRGDGFDRNLLDEGSKVLHGHWANGTGATLNITTTGGAVTAATIGSAGQGYPISSPQVLSVVGGGGSGALVTVQTDTNGQVSSVLAVNAGGTGYSNTSGARTQLQGTSWIVDNINGAVPNRFNPSHFDRFKDRNGDPIKGLLNGYGLPAGVTLSPTGPFYLNIFLAADGAVVATSGKALTNTTYWALIVGPIVPPEWNDSTFYLKGNLVYLLAPGDKRVVYLALTNGLNLKPDENPASWLEIGEDVMAGKGRFNLTTAYEFGDYVLPADVGTGVGIIHVEAYAEADYLLLGIPLIL